MEKKAKEAKIKYGPEYNRKGVLKVVSDTKKKRLAKRKPVTAEEKSARRYNLMIGFDAILYTEIKEALTKNNVKYSILADTYFVVKDLTEQEANNIIKSVQDISYTTKHKDGSPKCVYKVNYISKYTAQKMEVLRPEKRNKKPSNNTADTRSLNKCERALKRTVTPSTKRKSKRHLRRGLHSSGSNYTNYQKKTLARVKKACQYLAKLEAKKTVETSQKAKSKVISKVKQSKLKLAS